MYIRESITFIPNYGIFHFLAATDSSRMSILLNRLNVYNETFFKSLTINTKSEINDTNSAGVALIASPTQHNTKERSG